MVSFKHNFIFAPSLSFFSISYISFFPGLDTGVLGIWSGTRLETFLLSCAMPLMIHNYKEPWCLCIHCPNIPGSLNLFFPIFPGSLLSANYLFLLPRNLHWHVTFENEVIQDGCFFVFSHSHSHSFFLFTKLWWVINSRGIILGRY